MPQKNRISKLLVITNILFFVIICCLIGYIVFSKPKITESISNEDVYISENGDETESKYKLFKHSSLNATDPYGLANEHNILGKDISEILMGYEEGKDYEITKNDYFCSYTFTKDIKDYVTDGNTAKLSIYTDSDSDIITIVEYSFRIDSRNYDNSDSIFLSRAKRILTEYCDVDPIYDYVDDYNIVNIDKDTFNALIHDGVKSIYHVSWETEKGHAILTIENLHEERSNDWNVSFTE